LSYTELAYQVLSLYISTDDIPSNDLKNLLSRSYSTFRAQEITPLVHLKDNLYLLELFHGPSYSFKDCKSCRKKQLLTSLRGMKAPYNSWAIFLNTSLYGKIREKKEKVKNPAYCMPLVSRELTNMCRETSSDCCWRNKR